MERFSGHLSHRIYPDINFRKIPELTRCRSSLTRFPQNVRNNSECDLHSERGCRSSSSLSQRPSSSSCSCSSREMFDDEEEPLPDLKPTKYPSYVLTNSFLPPREMAKMWDLVARFVERRLDKGKGVNLPRLGTLTLHSQKMQLSQELYQHTLKPIFIVSGKFAIFHRLPQSSYRTSSDVPNMVLNFITLARILAIERDRTEMAYNETLEKISAILRSGKKASLPLRGIGQLVFCLESVKMNFAPEFLARNHTTKIIKITEKSGGYVCLR